jgi:hypothetical protein
MLVHGWLGGDVFGSLVISEEKVVSVFVAIEF